MSSADLPIRRYLWAVGPTAEQVAPGKQVAGRYEVIERHIWLDTQPNVSPDIPEEMPAVALPYMRLYPLRLYLPEVYGFCSIEKGSATFRVLLLENVPVDGSGCLYPTLQEVWPQTTAVRQVYWLWQILQLWEPLLKLGVASSLLAMEDLRVEGWRIRLRQLAMDRSAIASRMLSDTDDTDPDASESTAIPSLDAHPNLQDLGQCWSDLIGGAQPAIAERLQQICDRMQSPKVDAAAIAADLNRLLLEKAAEMPLRLQIAGITDTGPKRTHNEDICYPTLQDLSTHNTDANNPLIPHLTFVCDGIGGHAGGEVASQLAAQSVKLQIQALLAEIAEQPELVSPDLVVQQLEAIVRVVNNLISVRNDNQGREDRQRMGTTLVMALQLPQPIQTALGLESTNAHELYLVNVGDSRAYWMTSQYCHQLTIDDDVATREVRLGRSPHREISKRHYSGALTQALGTRDAELLRPIVQRFILEEDGLLLLCSDGLSDFDRVEEFWSDRTEAVLTGRLSVAAATQAWIDLANEKNGHDNTSVVLTHCHVSPDYPVPLTPDQTTTEMQLATLAGEEKEVSELSEASKALLYGEWSPDAAAAKVEEKPTKRGNRMIVFGVLLLLLAGTVGGLLLWRQLAPENFRRFRQQLPWLEQIWPTSNRDATN